MFRLAFQWSLWPPRLTDDEPIRDEADDAGFTCSRPGVNKERLDLSAPCLFFAVLLVCVLPGAGHVSAGAAKSFHKSLQGSRMTKERSARACEMQVQVCVCVCVSSLKSGTKRKKFFPLLSFLNKRSHCQELRRACNIAQCT